jgi:hypothetical protein
MQKKQRDGRASTKGSVEDEIAKPNAYLSTDKARHELGFDPSFRVTAHDACRHTFAFSLPVELERAAPGASFWSRSGLRSTRPVSQGRSAGQPSYFIAQN